MQGEYVPYSLEQNISIETCLRQNMWGARLKLPMKRSGTRQDYSFVVDFDDMTMGAVAWEWSTVVRRWNRDTPMRPSWDHQLENVRIVELQAGWTDHDRVLAHFFDTRPPSDSAAQRWRQVYEVVSIKRIQNRGHLRVFDAMRQQLEEMRGVEAVASTFVCAWHGSGTSSWDEWL